MLYASLGDAGAAHDPRDFGQSLAAPHGAIIRIDPLGGDGSRGYGVPADNPFVGEAGVAPEIWAYGLRHAQQFSWDTDGRMFMGDIGQNVVEEVNLGVPGANYGWRLREGTFGTGYTLTPRRPGPAYPPPAQDDRPFVYPVAQYDHDEGYAVSGGFVYRGEAIPELQGQYVFTDFPRGRVFYIDADGLVPGQLAEIRELRLIIDGEERDLVEAAGIPNTYAPGDRADARLGIDSAGELYLLTKSEAAPQHVRAGRPGGRPPGHRLGGRVLPARERRRVRKLERRERARSTRRRTARTPGGSVGRQAEPPAAIGGRGLASVGERPPLSGKHGPSRPGREQIQETVARLEMLALRDRRIEAGQVRPAGETLTSTSHPSRGARRGAGAPGRRWPPRAPAPPRATGPSPAAGRARSRRSCR